MPIAVATAFGLLAVCDRGLARPARDFAVALALITIAGYACITPSAFRWVPQCDALAVKSFAAVLLGAAGLTPVASLEDCTIKTRLVLLSLFAASLAVFAGIEPPCLRGPFGLIDRSVFALWPDKVQEMQSVAQLFRAEGIEVVVYLAFPLVATLSIIWVATSGLRTPVAWAVCAAFAVSLVIMVNQIRIIVYVIWLGLPFVGVAAQLLAERTPRIALVRTLAATLGSPAVVSLLAISGRWCAERETAGATVCSFSAHRRFEMAGRHVGADADPDSDHGERNRRDDESADLGSDRVRAGFLHLK